MEASEVFVKAAFLALINTKLVEWFIAPIFDWRGWERGLLRYVSGTTGLLLGLAAGVDLLADVGIVLDYGLGRLLTALVIGGGAGLIYDLFTDRGQPSLDKAASAGLRQPKLPPVGSGEN